MSFYLDKFGEGLINEDEGNKEGEDLLSERWDVTHKKASLGCYNHQHDEDEPEANPHSTREVLEALHLAELIHKTREIITLEKI